MPMEQFIKWLAENWIAVSGVLSVVIQISPIKLNPWSKLLGWIGKIINAELLKKIEEQDAKFGYMQRIIDENEKDRIRHEVLTFANQCRNHVMHTQDEFQHILAINKKYHDLLDKHKESNGVFDAEYEYILELYHECQHNNSFL